jgi:prepilin-type N-terminal cleavage/methylation domain-containing protein
MFKKGFTLLEAIISLTLILVIASSIVIIFNNSNPSKDLEARDTISSVKKILDKKRGDYTLESLNELNSDFQFIETNSESINEVSIILNEDVILLAVSNENEGCWLLRKDYEADSENLAEVYGYKEGYTCEADFASNLIRDGDEGSIRKPIIL